jgi:hypothetical protein
MRLVGDSVTAPNYIGIIRGEGHSARLGDVYYIEQAGGSLIEVSKKNVEVREPGMIDK